MAVKTITIDMEAYDTLVRARRGNESFSSVIKQTLGPTSNSARALLHHLESLVVSDALLSDYERVLSSRSDDMLAAEEPLDQ
ncbi:MAG: hypothetical protein EA383_16240 [Spirochaetaceae bacterium]|nr:MAG: hypothetical protein EA383_16240 [Spirochaetaceae bacterium]